MKPANFKDTLSVLNLIKKYLDGAMWRTVDAIELVKQLEDKKDLLSLDVALPDFYLKIDDNIEYAKLNSKIIGELAYKAEANTKGGDK